MKYLITGISILVLLLCVALLISWRSDHCLDETEAGLKQAADHFPDCDFPAIYAELKEAEAVWESHHGFFSCILSHTELEDVSCCFASLIAYAEQEEMAELQDAYARLRSLLEHLRVVDRPYYYNILSSIVNQKVV